MDQATSALLPFRGLRFDPGLPGGLAHTLGPPFDFDSSNEARAFADGRAHCAVRLEIEDPVDGLSFWQSRALLNEWQERGILLREDHPAYYVYEQQFEHDGAPLARRGVFGLVPLDAPGVDVMPHEETWEEIRQRRLRLLRNLDAAPSPVYLIYDGRDRSPAALLDEIATSQADACMTDSFGNRHRLWVVSDPASVERMRDLMRGQRYVIADGHHRFAAARDYHAQRGLPDTSRVLACCVEAHDPGIVIRPIHRLIRSRHAIDVTTAAGTLSEWFEIETSPVGARTGRELRGALTDGALPEAGVITNGGATFLRLRLRDWSIAESLLPGEACEPARRLDITVVSELVLRRALWVDPSATDAINYYDDAEDVLSLTRSAAGTGLLMRPIRLSQVFDVARSGGVVPAKSTSFVPKIPVGLVMQVFRAEG
ncbi:MAG TPA: DUF1015 domain-containing protein [Thermomicrobiales bacterium]|nr:DUF1015 domain-containing protein [Thermomicrobiales bacterium]